jgi:tetratricopeptide (TPR) repeat protein
MEDNLISEKIEKLISENKYKDAVKKLDNIVNGTIAVKNKLIFFEKYIAIADLIYKFNTTKQVIDESKKLLLKALGLFKSYKESNLFKNSNIARIYSMQYELSFILKAIQNNSNKVNFNKIEDIYLINGTIQESISYYRKNLRFLNREVNKLENYKIKMQYKEEIYNVKNNLANSLAYVGRFIEAITFLEENINDNSNNPESNTSWVETILKFKEISMLSETASLYCSLTERCFNALKSKKLIPDSILININKNIEYFEYVLLEMGFILSDNLIIENRKGEEDEFIKHSILRKFSLNNKLTLSTHAIYCKCLDSSIDDISLKSENIELNRLVDTIKSEFAFSRLLFFEFNNKNIMIPNDIIFLTDNHELGYKTEYLKTSYRICFSILDKLGNGIKKIYDLNTTRFYHFEHLFTKNKEKLKNIKNNISLLALYSLSLELNQDIGPLKHYKKLRNELEHGTEIKIVKDVSSENNMDTIGIKELEDFTYELLIIVKSAIFSFVSMIELEERKTKEKDIICHT